ncbi:MAG: exosome complex protein Rrp42 [Candidatus Bathyarchaeia archaeon]
MSEVLPKIRRKQIMDLLGEGKRIDGRGPSDYREIAIRVGTIENAIGSAEVSMGGTKVIAGVKMEVGEPFHDTPDEGALIVSTQLLPISSPTAKPGRPTEGEIILGRVIDRAVRSSEAVDLNQLCIRKGEKAFALFIDIGVLNQDGNLPDSCMIATLSALMSAQVRDYSLKRGEIEFGTSYKPFPLKKHPLLVTVEKIGSHLIVDPCLDEELAADATINIGIDDDGNICALLKGGGTFTAEEIQRSIDIATSKYGELIKTVQMNIGKKT